MPDGTTIDLFASAGDGLSPDHFGLDERGCAYVVAAPFAKAMGYSSTQKATDLVDPDERGQLQRLTPGGPQMVGVIFENGIWELIFRSSLPSARAIKGRVKEILRTLRETGVVDVRPAEAALPHDYETALEHLLASVRERRARHATPSSSRTPPAHAGPWTLPA